ncbi:MAG: hypothetical protein CMF62_02720 [Magnetococcales bacterium]|nr:hypothetical protein [Magnetococcales bacterium]|tara:strand:- start:43472 stop:44104 length:633 start_codon:yes stop_codon:yes gene_type:complete
MPKIAIILFGISYLKSYKHWNNQFLNIDYRKSVENYKKHFIDFYSKYYDIDFYLSTYLNPLKKQLLNDFKPVSTNFVHHFNTNRRLSRNSLIKAGVLNCLKYSSENNVNYKLVLITRFDLLFNQEFEKSNIDYSKINLVSVLEKSKFIDDNLYIMPFKFLNPFLKVIKDINKNSHELRKELESITDLNYIKNENKRVAKLTFFDIVRSKA